MFPPACHDRSSLVLALLVLWLLPAAPLPAAQVADLYSAEVELPAPGDLDGAFALALERVLAKVTGRRQPLDDSQRERFGDPARLVRQYRGTAPGRLRVGFDPVALKRLVDAAGLPTWGEARPLVVVWLVMETGRGAREILSAGEAGQGTAFGPASAADQARALLLAAAEARGLPLVLPLVDSEDLARVSDSDLRGDFTEPVIAASERYGADAVLIGRLRGADPATARVRWTLLLGRERMDWSGGLEDGPDGAADRLAERLAVAPGEERWLRVEIGNVRSLRDYGQVYRLFSGLGLVEQLQVAEVSEDRLRLALRVRGGIDPLMRSVALRRLLSVDEQATGTPGADLYYRLPGD